MAGLAMWVPASAALASKLIPAAVLGTAGLRFMLTGAYELSAASSWQHIAGIVGLLLCALGVYAALAMTHEDALGATVLPLGRGAAAAPTWRARAAGSTRRPESATSCESVRRGSSTRPEAETPRLKRGRHRAQDPVASKHRGCVPGSPT